MPANTLKATVQEKYGEAAKRAAAGAQGSCCGPVSSCCGASADTEIFDPITSNLYDAGLASEVDGKFMGAFIRATKKPAGNG